MFILEVQTLIKVTVFLLEDLLVLTPIAYSCCNNKMDCGLVALLMICAFAED